MNRYLCLLLILIVFSAINSCTKTDNSPIYSGEIKRQTTDCTSSDNGYLFVIKVDNTNLYDSFYTSTLPHEFWPSIGKKISFRIRDYKSGENLIICSTQIVGAKFYVIYDVTN